MAALPFSFRNHGKTFSGRFKAFHFGKAYRDVRQIIIKKVPHGKLAEGSTKNERGQPVCRTFSLNLSRAKVRHDFHILLHFIEK